MRDRGTVRGSSALDAEDVMRKLARVGDRIAELRSDVDRARGKAEVLLARMRKEFGVDGPDELREEIARISKKVEKDSAAIADGVRELEGKYGLSKY